jgi:truncated hemoglobin YjbI
MEDLFGKYGGMPFWADFIDNFYEKATTDSSLRDFFANKDVQKIKQMQLSLVEMSMTGSRFSEETIQRAHKNLVVTDALFQHFVRLYESTLIELDVEPEDATHIVETLLAYKQPIIQASRAS